MVKMKMLAGFAAVAVAASAVPAQAVVTTFATFAPLSAEAQVAGYSNFRWVNSNPATGTANGSNGQQGTLFSTATNGTTAPAGARDVSFSFLIPGLSALVNNATATYTWGGGTLPVQLATRVISGSTNTLTQAGIDGSFAFISTAPITVNTTTYAAGSLLLGGVYTGGTITGLQGGANAAFGADSSASGQTLTFYSDFVDFTGATTSIFGLELANLRSTLSALQTTQTPITAVRTFRSSASGSFGADGELIVNGIPEPQTWGLMVVGFGMIGMQVRRRNRRTSVTA